MAEKIVDKFISSPIPFRNHTKKQLHKLIDHPLFRKMVLAKEFYKKTFDGEVWFYPRVNVKNGRHG